MKITQIDRRPTVNDPEGTYKLIKGGLYWGHWYVGQNWYGAKFVAPADPRDGLPY